MNVLASLSASLGCSPWGAAPPPGEITVRLTAPDGRRERSIDDKDTALGTSPDDVSKPSSLHRGSAGAQDSKPLSLRRGVSGADYEHVRFLAWQCRLMLATSTALLCVGIVGFACGQLVAGATGFISSLASLNYWRKPGRSWRRDADLFFAGAAILYFILAASTLDGIANASAWLCFTCFGVCFRCSWALSAVSDEWWAMWHAGGHVSIGAASLCLFYGDGDAWLLHSQSEGARLPGTTFNVPAVLSFALLAVFGKWVDRWLVGGGGRKSPLLL